MKNRYYNGESAMGLDVDLRYSDLYLDILDKNTGKVIKRYFFEDVRILEKPVPPLGGKLGFTDNNDARLSVGDPDLIKNIAPFISKENDLGHKMSFMWVHLAIYSVVAISFTIACAYYGPRVMEHAAYLIPPNIEKQFGKTVLNQTRYVTRICSEESGLDALDKLIEPMKHDGNYIVYVSAQDIVNAFALPGPYIVIFDGLIEQADSPEELAAIIAHEMGHVHERHPMRGYMRVMGLSLVFKMMFGDVGNLGNPGELAAVLRSLNYNREQELEADMFSVRKMKAANYNPYALNDFFEKLLVDEPEDMPDFFKYISTHPETQKRIATIQELKDQDNTKYKPALSSSEWKALQNICTETKIRQ